MAKKTQIVHVALDKDTERILKQDAREEDIPLSQIIRKAINFYISEGQRRRYLATTAKQPEQAV